MRKFIDIIKESVEYVAYHDEDNHPHEMRSEEDFKREVATGDLTPDTKVTIYTQSDEPRMMDAKQHPGLAKLFKEKAVGDYQEKRRDIDAKIPDFMPFVFKDVDGFQREVRTEEDMRKEIKGEYLEPDMRIAVYKKGEKRPLAMSVSEHPSAHLFN